MDTFFYLIIFAGAIAGASTGLLGVYIVGMRMPFIGTCISHAAMAGTIFSCLLGINPIMKLDNWIKIIKENYEIIKLDDCLPLMYSSIFKGVTNFETQAVELYNKCLHEIK